MAEDQDYATVSGQRVHRSDFAYVGDPDDKSTWKLPIHDASHVRNALARWNQTDLPAAAKAGVWRKIVAAAKKFGIHVSDEESELVIHNSEFKIVNLVSRSLRLALDVPQIVDVGARRAVPLHTHAICVTGEWYKNGRKFLIKADDLRAMAANFAKRKNDMVVVDFEHASEQPEVARGGPVPAAGWIHELRADGAGAIHESPLLVAQIEWTPQALELIRSGQYRFFSPAIDFDAKDKETGEPQGATLTSGALTNHPFLEELPAITLSDDCRLPMDDGRLQSSILNRQFSMTDGGAMKKFTLKKLDAGEHAGHHGVFDGDECTGYIDKDHFEGYAKKALEGMEASCHSEHLTEDHKRLVELGRETEADRAHAASRAVVLAECLNQDSGSRSQDSALNPRSQILNPEKIKVLLRAGKISAEDFIDAHDTAELVERAVQEGRVLPKDRIAAFKIALSPESSGRDYREFLKTAPRVVHLGSVGLATGTGINVDDEIQLKVNDKLKADQKLTYSEAFSQILASDSALAERYHRAHTQRIGAEGPAQ